MATASEADDLDNFLASVQHRAFAMARAATRHDEDAMDIVQDAMLQLVRRYSNRTPDEWRMLFFRILQNRINDNFRRQKVRNKVIGWLPGSHGTDSKENDFGEEDKFEQVPTPATDEPDRHLERQQNIEKLHIAVGLLSRRQREAFMLRCWEGLSTTETAATMQCSEGSVKTHYSRAMAALRSWLEENE